MGLTVTHVYGDADGDTHLAALEIPADPNFPYPDLVALEIPTTSMLHIEYPPASGQVIPGLHCTPRRQFDLCLDGGMEVTTSTGESQVFGPGDWILFDDVGSKGHSTRDVGDVRRVLLVIGIADDWTLPVPPP